MHAEKGRTNVCATDCGIVSCRHSAASTLRTRKVERRNSRSLFVVSNFREWFKFRIENNKKYTKRLIAKQEHNTHTQCNFTSGENLKVGKHSLCIIQGRRTITPTDQHVSGG